jgi:Tol biopolymer transport system component
VLVIVLGGALAWFARPLPPPRILSTTQITHDGLGKRNVLTDGSRLYIVEDKAFHPYFVQASVVGGDTSVIPTPFANANVVATAISPDHSQLLAASFIGTQTQAQFWTVPVPTGTPRPLADVVGQFATWSPDGRLLAFAKGSEIFVANADGTNARKVSTLSGLAYWMRFSPDATRLRFTLGTPGSASSSIWEVHVDGSGLHPLLPGWHTPPAECCDEWSSDGRYYLFVSGSSGISNIFALREQRRLFTRQSEPFQLTTGPLSLPFFVPSPDNKKVFADGQSPRGELVRYDNRSQQFLPFFAGIWAGEMDFSGDGKWVAYVSYEDRSLWRARVDGSERLQLTSPPVYAFLPRWSPDGTRIVYTDLQSGPFKILLVSANGGKPQRMFTESQDQIDPSWSPDGKQVVYGRSWLTPEKLSIQVLDLESKRVSTVPGSEGLYSPHWSPDGRHLAAMSADAKKLLLFDFKTQRWTNWMIDEPGAIGFPTWSRDGKYIYYDTTSTENTAFRRIEVGQTRSEFLIDLRDLHRYSDGVGWSGLAPDGSALFVRDLSTDEIYSLEVDLP